MSRQQQEEELRTFILKGLEATDPNDIFGCLELLPELSALLTDDKKKGEKLDALYSSLLAQLASLWISNADQNQGFAILYHLCLQDLTTDNWGGPFDRGIRDRHLGVVLDRYVDGFTTWVEALDRQQAPAPQPMTPSIVLERFPNAGAALREVGAKKSRPNILLLLVGGLKNYGAHATPEEDSFAPGRVGRIAVLLREGGSVVTARYDYNQTNMLHHLAKLGDGKAIRYAVSRGGAEVDAPDKNGQSALFWAAKERAGAYAIRALVESGADVNATCNYGRTALFNAAYGGSSMAVTTLIELGADPNANVDNLLTPVAMSARSGNLPTALALVEGGATITDHAVKECKDKDRFEVTAYFDLVLGTPVLPANQARSMMEAVATDLGAKAGTSAIDSGDYANYCEDNAEALLVGQYWEAQYLGLVEEKMATLSAEARAELDSQADLMEVLQSLYTAAFETSLDY